MLKKYTIGNGALLESTEEKAPVMVYTDPSKQEISELINTYSIDEHNFNSALDPEELGRFEYDAWGNHVVLILKRPNNVNLDDNEEFATISLGTFLFPDKLIIVSREEINLFDCRQVNTLHTIYDVLVKLIYSTINKFIEHLKLIHYMSDKLEDKLSRSLENKYLFEMFRLEKSLVYYLNGVNANGTTFRRLKAQAEKIGFNEDNIEFLDDIIIENNQCNKQIEIYSDILTGLMDARSSIVNNNMNHLIRKLTIISIVFMPLNIVASMGGMSEFSIWTKNMPWWESYGLFMLGMLVIGYITFLLIKDLGLEKQPRRKFRYRVSKYIPFV